MKQHSFAFHNFDGGNGGVCYGFSMVTYLNYIGKLPIQGEPYSGYPEYNLNNVSCFSKNQLYNDKERNLFISEDNYKIGDRKFPNSVVQTIQCIIHWTGKQHNVKDRFGKSVMEKSTVQNIKTRLLSKEPVLITLTKINGYHSVLAYAMYETPEADYILVYESNAPGQEKYIKLYKELSSYTKVEYIPYPNVKYSSSKSDYAHLDLYQNIRLTNVTIPEGPYVKHTESLTTETTTKPTNDNDYTAEDLINKSVTEIVKMMGNEFNVSLIDGGYFYNYDKFPGMDFHIRHSINDEQKLKEIISSGYVDLWGIQVNSPGKGCRNGDKIISADMDFAQFAKIYGKVSCKPSRGALVSGSPVEALGYTQEKDTYTITFNFGLTHDNVHLAYKEEISYEDMLQANPNIKNIVIERNSTVYKYYINSEKIQKYNDKIYYTSEFKHEGIGGNIDLSSISSEYIALPTFDDKEIDNFVIYDDKIYFTDQAIGSSPEPKLSTLYQCNMDGSDISVIEENTDRCFLIEYNTIKYSINGLQEYHRYDIGTKQIQNIDTSNEYILPSRIFTKEQKWGIENGERYLDGIYYKELNRDNNDYLHNVFYYRKDVITGSVIQIGTGHVPQV